MTENTNIIVTNDIGIIKTGANFTLTQFVRVIEMEKKGFIPFGEI